MATGFNNGSLIVENDTFSDTVISGNSKINLVNNTITDLNNVQSIDWVGRLFRGNNGNVRLDYQNSIIYDTSVVQSINFQTRKLFNSGETQTIDYQNELLTNSGAITSIDWSMRKLYDTSGNQTLGYSNKDHIQINGIQGNVVANGSFGDATLVAGTVTVANTSITANSRIVPTSQSNAVVGSLRATTIVGTSFTITSSLATDAGSVFWQKIELN